MTRCCQPLAPKSALAALALLLAGCPNPANDDDSAAPEPTPAPTSTPAPTPTTTPTLVEYCDGIDNDGDGVADNGYPDVDGDGIGDCVDASCQLSVATPPPPLESCTGPDGAIGELYDFAAVGFIEIVDGWPRTLGTDLCGAIQLADDNGDGLVDDTDSVDFVMGSILGSGPHDLEVNIHDGATGQLSSAATAGFLALVTGGLPGPQITSFGLGWLQEQDPVPFCSGTPANAPGLCSVADPPGPAGHQQSRPGISAVTNPTGEQGPAFQFRGSIYGSDGELLWTPVGPTNHQDSTSAEVLDLDRDGHPEVLAPDGVYDGFGLRLWEFPLVGDPSTPGGGPVGAGLGSSVFAVQADSDPEAEVLFVSMNEINLYQHDGTLISARAREPAVPRVGCVADFDGDESPEVGLVESPINGVPMGHRVAVYDLDGEQVWSRPVLGLENLGDTPCSAFDFDGDGAWEFLLQDQTRLYGWDVRRDREVLYWDEFWSATSGEHPMAVDIDRDGSAELVLCVGSADSLGSSAESGGIVLFGSPRGLWAQGALAWPGLNYRAGGYAPTGEPISPPVPTWLGENSYRAAPASPPRPFADLHVDVAAGCTSSCEEDGLIHLQVRVTNQGTRTSPKGIPLMLQRSELEWGEDDPGGRQVIWQTEVPKLSPGMTTGPIDVVVRRGPPPFTGFSRNPLYSKLIWRFVVDPTAELLAGDTANEHYGQLVECDESDQVVEWEDPCPIDQ